jgi:hypothetical protein
MDTMHFEAETFNDIAIIGEIDIPEEALLHPNVQDLESCLSKRCMTSIVHKPVLGTANKNKTELYGWNHGVGLHTDNNGYIYLVILNDIIGDIYGEDYNRLPYKKGSIIKINDFKQHAVQQRGYAMALFIGVFDNECNDHAMSLLKDGLTSLCQNHANEYAPNCHDQTLKNNFYL